MHPKYKRKAKKAAPKSVQSRKFPGLALPDTESVYVEPIGKRPAAEDFLEPSRKRPRSPDGADRQERSAVERESWSRDRRDERSIPNHRHLDDRPVLYKIYDGTVTNLRDFGAFVAIDGLASRTEGMVHVSMITGARINTPAEVLRRNQRVKVKVMSIQPGNKYGLSMKDVDQSTGADMSYVLL